MNSAHEGAPHGVPSYWSWAQQPSLGHATPPAGMSALTSWGQIYADTSNTHPANVRVEVRNMETYVWSNSSRAWIRVQGASRVDGAHFVEDFAGNAAVATDLRNEADGGNSTGMVSGYNFHFWPTGMRGNLPNPSDIGAVYTTVQARLILDDPTGPDNRSQARYLANTGADWWRTTSAPLRRRLQQPRRRPRPLHLRHHQLDRPRLLHRRPHRHRPRLLDRNPTRHQPTPHQRHVMAPRAGAAKREQ